MSHRNKKRSLHQITYGLPLPSPYHKRQKLTCNDEQYQSIFKALHDLQSINIPSLICKEIAEYATGFELDCVNKRKGCKGKIILLRRDFHDTSYNHHRFVRHAAASFEYHCQECMKHAKQCPKCHYPVCRFGLHHTKCCGRYMPKCGDGDQHTCAALNCDKKICAQCGHYSRAKCDPKKNSFFCSRDFSAALTGASVACKLCNGGCGASICLSHSNCTFWRCLHRQPIMKKCFVNGCRIMVCCKCGISEGCDLCGDKEVWCANHARKRSKTFVCKTCW